jgi:hypothetical protein
MALIGALPISRGGSQVVHCLDESGDATYFSEGDITSTLINNADPAGTARAGQIRRCIKVIRLQASKGQASRLFTWVATATGPFVRAVATPLPSGAQPPRALV